MQIVVLGMHRSGTSAVTRLVNMMGAYFGVEGISTGLNQENPKGFWERRDVRRLNDQLLFSVDADWDRIADFELSKLSPKEIDAFTFDARQVILNLDAHRPWIVKEPRLCLLFPLWKKLLEVPTLIVVHRHPLEIAHSLKTRNGFSLPFGIALWEKYILSMCQGIAGMNPVFVDHHALMTNTLATAAKLFQDLTGSGVQGLHLPQDREITSFIEPALYRERCDASLTGAYLNQAQLELLDRLHRHQLPGPDEIPQLSAGAAALLEEHEAMHECRRRITLLETSHEEDGEKLATALRDNERLTRQEAEQSRSAGTLKGQVEDLERRLKYEMDAFDRTGLQLEQQQQRVSSLTTRLDAVTGAHEQLQHRASELEEEVKAGRQTIERLTDEHREMKAAVEAYALQVAELEPFRDRAQLNEARLDIVREQLGHARSEKKELITHLEEIESRLNGLHESQHAFGDELGKTNSILTHGQETIHELFDKESEHEQRAVHLEGQNRDLSSRLVAHEQKLEHLRSTEKELAAKLHEKQRDVDRLNAKTHEKQQAVDHWKQKYADLEAAYEGIRSSTLWKFGALLDRIRGLVTLRSFRG